MSFKFVGHKIIARVVEEKLWRDYDEKGLSILEIKDRITNPKRLIEITKEEIENRKEEQVNDFVLFPETVLQNLISVSLSGLISSLVQGGFLSQEVVDLTSKLTRPEDIYITGKSRFSGGYNLDYGRDLDTFPKDNSERPRIVINPEIIKAWGAQLLDASEKANHKFTNEQVNIVASTVVAFHEWSHSVERALTILYMQTAKTINGIDFEKDSGGIRKLGLSLVFDKAKKISSPVIDNLDDRREANAFSMHIERFATGFEHLAILELIKKIKYSPKDSEIFMEAYLKNAREKLEEFKILRKSLLLSDSDLWNLFNSIRTFLKENGVEDAEYIENLWDDLGYLTPYNRDELVKIVNQSYLYATDKESVKLDILNYNKQLETI